MDRMKSKSKKKVSAGRDEDRLFSLFTRHPEKTEFSVDEVPSKTELNKLPSPFVSELDLDSDLMIPLVCKKDAFKETENPVHLIEAFLLAHEAGMYPPMWVLNKIAEVFREYHASNGNKDLDKLFGFKRGVGQSKAFQNIFEEYRDQCLTRDVFKLNVLFGISIEDAAHMTASRLAEMPSWNTTVLDIKEISGETLKDKYLKKWKKVWDNKWTKKHVTEMSKEEKIAFLKLFPKHSIPPKYWIHLD